MLINEKKSGDNIIDLHTRAAAVINSSILLEPVDIVESQTEITTLPLVSTELS